MKKLIGPNHRVFLGLSALFVLVSAYFLSQFSKAEIHLWVNAHYSDGADLIFKYGTHLGDGWIFAALIFPFLAFKRRAMLALILGAVFTLLFSGGIKQYFKDEPRPVKFFETQEASLRLVPGVDNHHYRSFPSGHTTSAFAAWGLLAFFLAKPSYQGIFFAVALMVAYSRMYLSQHFLRDLTAGAVLGSFIALLSYQLSAYLAPEWGQKKWFKA